MTVPFVFSFESKREDVPVVSSVWGCNQYGCFRAVEWSGIPQSFFICKKAPSLLEEPGQYKQPGLIVIRLGYKSPFSVFREQSVGDHLRISRSNNYRVPEIRP